MPGLALVRLSMLEDSSGFPYSKFQETDSDLLTTSRTRQESGSGDVGERTGSVPESIGVYSEWMNDVLIVNDEFFVHEE